MVFEPTGERLESLIGNGDALRLLINFEIARTRPLTTKMWESLFLEIEQAALNAEFETYAKAAGDNYGEEGFNYLRRHTDRFVVTSVGRGSIVIDGVVILAVGGAWFIKQFIAPGWEKSTSKAQWDNAVASTIDKASEILKQQISYRVAHRLKRLGIRNFSLPPPREIEGRRLTENQTMPEEPQRLTQKHPLAIKKKPPH